MYNLTNIERLASKAVDLKAFPLNLTEVRDNVRLLLSELQRYGFYNEYTTHSFDHVYAMLEMADWIIPKSTKELLTPGDYLFLTLSIYFHDLGLLISTNEYKGRKQNPDYQRYLTQQFITNVDYLEYQDKLSKLTEDERERILYQEFVRATHGARVRAWIEGSSLDDNELSASIRSAIQSLIGKLDSSARQGLAMLCESHTIDDISDTSKYKVSMPYGDSKEETVNLQYIAIILRTVDLLQVTRGRAPSILYQLISPKDPISQIEWQKQNAVRNIRAAPGRDREGKASDIAQSDTIQFFARFEKSDGFFGLTSYLAYVRSQLSACHEALKKSEFELPNPPTFPWKFIDDDGVEAVGFLTQSFGFELDQHKILDLLTGHTLYNDTDVVIRELTQNALDAVRLQYSTPQPSSTGGRIDISWDDATKTLEVRDNGTGMSQVVIEDHLLKVGSSRYQDPKFKESYPEFSSISRFGIGVLSAFMVADNVEITTCSLEDDHARQISLRSVHGKYLIKLLDKITQKDEIGVFPHGSRVRLKLRSTAKIGDVLQVARMWLLFPRCDVYVKIDSDDAVKIGYDSPKQALEYFIDESKYFSISREIHEVREVTDDGVTLAFVVERDELFKDWSFSAAPERHYSSYDDLRPIIATCVEGVGVEFTSPGFKNNKILSVANIVGKGAPKTNVARSALEDTSEYRETLKKIYKLYSKHVISEVDRLSQSLEYSLSRAVEQAPFIAYPLTKIAENASQPHVLKDELARIPYILMEEDGERKNISMRELKEQNYFWTINSPLLSSVELFVREAQKNVSAFSVLSNLQEGGVELPKGAIFCNFGGDTYIEETVREVFEPVVFEANENARRLSIKWEKIQSKPRWMSNYDIIQDVGSIDRTLRRAFQQLQENHRHRGSRDPAYIHLAVSDNVVVHNLDGFSEFIADRKLFLHPSDPLSKYIREIWESASPNNKISVFSILTVYSLLRGYYIPRDEFTGDWIERLLSTSNLESLSEYIDRPSFVEVIRKREVKIFNPFAWKRRVTEEE
ncbi:ATP-binding protein [Pseudomonas sp. Irchel s3a12]|uniref:HD domain-containing protein n=1 Tax=Pseudomonas sp. Irchel s3a12 TaxID=2009047 RepID=UPI000BA418A4|nr:ATP-binding protein [Pseudomonas sp. Irchel s3a12]